MHNFIYIYTHAQYFLQELEYCIRERENKLEIEKQKYSWNIILFNQYFLQLSELISMMFNFERDHAEIHEELEESNVKDKRYIREFYMRFTSRGIYPTDLQSKNEFRSIEENLNANITLKELTINSILNTNNEELIKATIKNAPIDTYHVFLKCAIYTFNDFVVRVLKTVYKKLLL